MDGPLVPLLLVGLLQLVEALVSAAVGANVQRGDQIEVVASKFEPADLAPPAFYEQPWFAMLARYGAMLIAVLLVLLLAVRPLIAKLKGRNDPAKPATDAALAVSESGADESAQGGMAIGRDGSGVSITDLPQQVELARRLATSQPERAVEALQRMLLEGPDQRGNGAGAA